MDSNVEVISLTKKEIRFIIKSIPISIANSLRNIMQLEVPTMTIEKVLIECNTSTQLDEFISHRLGLIPFCCDIDKYNFCQKCECEMGCDKCTIEVFIDKTCEIGEVYNLTSRDIICVDKCVYPAHDLYNDIFEKLKIPIHTNGYEIVNLGKGQTFKAKCILKKGCGNEHVKWSPCSVSLQEQYSIEFDSNINDILSLEQKKTLVSCCHKNVYKLNNNEILDIEDNLLCDSCGKCNEKLEQMNQDNKLITIKSLKNFIFKVKTFGSIPPEDILIKGLQVLENKLLKLKNNVMKINE